MSDLPTPTMPLSPTTLPRGSLHRPSDALRVGQIPEARGGIEVSWARNLDEVREAQKLRFDVFVSEMGAQLSTTVAGHDIDLFDDYCEHLLVRDTQSRQVIGTYRVLTPVQARRVGSTTATPNLTSPVCAACAIGWWSWVAAACTPTTAMAAWCWPSGARWPTSWCATRSTP